MAVLAVLFLSYDTPKVAVDQRQPKDRFAQPELRLRQLYSSVEFRRKLRGDILRKPNQAAVMMKPPSRDPPFSGISSAGVE
jgi:hypothetical protein